MKSRRPLVGCSRTRLDFCADFFSQLSALKQELLSDGYMKADEQIRLFNNNKMPLKPGCDPIQVLNQTQQK